MKAHHIFIFSNSEGKEADALIELGFVEGSNRVHPGQGTRNRKFYFADFFLEILWVSNEAEIKSELTSATGLWERSQYHKNGSSRFGLCLENTDETNELFAESMKYKPVYLPEGMEIDVISNTNAPWLPWTFRLPFSNSTNSVDEPITHKTGAEQLTKVLFGLPENRLKRGFIQHFNFNSGGDICFESSESLNLTLEFDKGKTGKSIKVEELDLIINY